MVTALNNPVLPGKCGLNIAIVLDLSNSLLDTHVASSKTAAKSVVDSLRGTPSSVGAYTFGTFAPDRTNASIAKSSVSTTNGANTVNTKIGQFSRVPTSVGGTNWDAALRQIPTSQYDIVLFVTDGNPTAYGTPNSNGNQSVPGTTLILG
ncbi:VWA domain-containing protein [Arthrobacter alpinus]|nr:VWA domain-containing protein [Arthrobacter alpinus]